MKLITFLLLLLSALTLNAAVSCPPVFGDHMVLQRDRPVAIWGEASAEESIRILFADQSVTTVADAAGHWMAKLAPLAANATPQTLTIRGENELVFTDVLVGEVWFCSGQSNMEKQLGPRKGQKPTDDYEAELARSDTPLLRLYQGLHAIKPKSSESLLRWLPCNAGNLTDTEFSAAAYYFGRELQRELGVPVGLINSSFGGTRIEAWMPREAFASDPLLKGMESVEYDHWVPGVQATELYQSRILPYVPFTLRGFLWYQGETNVMNAEGMIYAAKQRALVAAWRQAWGDPKAPFYYALLAPFAYSHQKKWAKQLTPETLPAFWEAQVAASDVGHTGFIVITDLAGSGKDIHPTNKRDVGLRFARLALADTYGRTAMAAYGPQFLRLHRPWFGRNLSITFRHAEGLRSRDGQPLTGFTIAGADQRFYPATAVIKNHGVIVSSPEVPHPVAVRFAWDELAMPNLVNGAGMPAVPFRTDDWPVTLEVPKTP